LSFIHIVPAHHGLKLSQASWTYYPQTEAEWLFHCVLISLYFCFNIQFYEQMDRATMGSPLFPMVANYFMEDFTEGAFSGATSDVCWQFWFAENTCVIRPHGKERLKDFLDYLNSRYCNKQFTVETTFPDVDIFSTKGRSLGHTVYRKARYMKLYLSARSHHQPTSKCAQYCSSWHTGPQPSATRTVSQADLDTHQSISPNSRYTLVEIHTFSICQCRSHHLETAKVC
jgi:hypothetical protein